MSTLQVRSSHKYLLVRFFQKFREAEDEFRQAVRSHLVTWLGWKTKMESIRTTYQEFQIENLMVFSMVDLTCKSWTPKMVDIQYQKSYFPLVGPKKIVFPLHFGDLVVFHLKGMHHLHTKSSARRVAFLSPS